MVAKSGANGKSQFCGGERGVFLTELTEWGMESGTGEFDRMDGMGTGWGGAGSGREKEDNG